MGMPEHCSGPVGVCFPFRSNSADPVAKWLVGIVACMKLFELRLDCVGGRFSTRIDRELLY